MVGTELSQSFTNLDTLQQKYQSVIDLYKLKWIDLDIEGGALHDMPANDRRSQVMVRLKKANPGLRVSYTLPVFPTGLTAGGVAVLESAAKAGLDLDGKISK